MKKRKEGSGENEERKERRKKGVLAEPIDKKEVGKADFSQSWQIYLSIELHCYTSLCAFEIWKEVGEEIRKER